MRNFATTVITATAVGFSCLRAELVTRLVVLKMPPAAAPAVRAALAENAADPAAMDAVLDLPGVGELADFTESDPWRRSILFLTRETGRIAYEGESKKTLGVQLGFKELDTSIGVEEILTTNIVLPTSTSDYREFENTGNGMISALGKWQERACWGDAGGSLMLWQHVTARGEEDAGRTSGDGKIPAVRVEMLWFKAAASDIHKVTRSQPATRETALQWLTGRATLMKECGFLIRPGDEAMWRDVRGKYVSVDGYAEVSREGFTIRAKLAEAEGGFRMDWTATIRDTARHERSSPALTATPAAGVWEFVPLEGLEETTVVACRLTSDSR